MSKFIYILLLFCINLFSVDFGTILSSKDKSNLIAKDISSILNKYNIDLKIKNTLSSYESIHKLINNKNNYFFAIITKGSLSYYKQQYNFNYNKLPAILPLGDEQIHIFTNENNNFDFEQNKTFNVYCGEKNSDSCIASQNIQNFYSFKFNYINSSEENIFNDLKNNIIDLFISIKEAPYNVYKNIKFIKLIELPTNFKMEDVYVNSVITNNDYSYIDENIHVFAAKRVLITNLKDIKYNNAINSLLKIILLNQNYLEKQNNYKWEEIDFEYFDFKKFSINAKKTIKILNEQRKKQDALIF